MSSKTIIPPEVLWAQRSNANDEAKNVLYITVNIPDSKNVKVDLKPDHLQLESDSDDEPKDHYKLHLDFYKEIVPELSRYHANGINIVFEVRKKEKQEEFWPRLTKEKVKYHYIKTDFDKWVDEDEQEEEEEKQDEPADAGFNGDMMQQLLQQGQGGGAGGFPGLDALGDLKGALGGLGGGALGGLGGAEAAGDLPDSLKATEGDFSSSDDDEGADTAAASESEPLD